MIYGRALDDDIDREILVARQAGKNHDEIADLIGLDKSSVSRRLRRIKEKYDARNQ